MSKYKFKFTEEDFVKNWENSNLLTRVRYCGLVWIKENLHTEYSAIYQGEDILILTHKH